MPNLNVSYDELRAESARIRHAAAELADLTADLEARQASLVARGYVMDSASLGVNEALGQFSEGRALVLSSLEVIAQHLSQSADVLASADADLSRQISG